MDKRWGVAAALTGIVLAAPGVAGAEELVGTADAVSAEVGGIVSVSQTNAEATQTGGSSSADVLNVGGTTVIGGESDGSGKLFGTGSTPIGEADVAPWQANTGTEGSCRTANANAAIAGANVADAIDVAVLQSSSAARHCGNSSGGDASSDGAVISFGDALRLVLLHSDASTSNEKPNSWVIGINDTRLLTDEDLGSSCVVQIPSLVGLICLSVSGGTAAGDPISAALAQLDAGDGALGAAAFGAAADPDEAARSAATPEVLSGTTAPADAAAAASTGSLARTGLELGAMAFVGANLAAAGALLRRRARR